MYNHLINYYRFSVSDIYKVCKKANNVRIEKILDSQLFFRKVDNSSDMYTLCSKDDDNAIEMDLKDINHDCLLLPSTTTSVSKVLFLIEIQY